MTKLETELNNLFLKSFEKSSENQIDLASIKHLSKDNYSKELSKIVKELKLKNELKDRSGWYFIILETNLNDLKKIKSQGRHVDLHKTSTLNEKLGEIVSTKVHYFGMAENLRARIREHLNKYQNTKTGCLALGRYSVKLRVGFIFEDELIKNSKLDEKILSDKDLRYRFRIIVENIFRAKYGWPILCKN